ncbi:bifunctional glycosyltransferase family 2 protein/CDP-glycerol:glycerophosphate glycerophosphotransferase [Planococcus sp. N064]|uniref:Bifunctional glycosyltransferase family 2 protein/CDP-glycerol:glycerophosphate glycerophosphotransferase n=1 Tax=Planococcus liqunii TaxID=3058394 RepID=A0ABT8MN74_9BACL|nr:bifunctional glycosyltransferase family 2 protein/CDP-glycerol:glycerophosphate glycerophosphotransferase [Planococcus sp. N064]MDN7226337.1 bifunctional glycosyltransferase family 2 protein/CDP-glycerol:glycerophosphate glycerophosphotransferase [Planococcus sp. N064]
MVDDFQMQRGPKLSVVVIAFNNELYIEEALESLYEQTFTDFEVVVVNDFSSDQTGALIDRFVAGKTNFRAIHLTKNSGGCSTPRNTGIAHARGEYIMFLDGDDWYTIDACEKMVEAMDRTGSDFVAGQVIRTNNYEIWYHKQIYSKERLNFNVREFTYMLFDSLSVNKIYKRSFLDYHGLRFPEGIHYEDVVFTGKAYFLAETISVIPEPIYYWRVVENAEAKSITNRRHEFENFENRIIAHRYFDQSLRENGAVLYQKEKNNKFLRHDLKLYTNDYLQYDEDYKARFHQLIHQYMHEVMDEYAFIGLSEQDRIMSYLMYLGDVEAFEDYVNYINGLPTQKNRVCSIGTQYYFLPTVPAKNHEKFLYTEKPKIDYEITDLELSLESFSFQGLLYVNSISESEYSSYWVLRNRQTGKALTAVAEADGKVVFSVQNMTAGNYYLSLYVKHMGNLHRILVKNSNISELPNIELIENNLSKSIFINEKNSLAIRVAPEKLFNQLLWKVEKRKLAKNQQKAGFSPSPSPMRKALERLIPKFPLKSNWVLFESHMGKQYSDSPKYIYEQMIESGYKFKYIWVFQKPDQLELPGDAVKVKKNSLKHLYYLNRAKYWIDNQGIAHLAKKKEKQIYVQTWHGTPLKKMGYDQKKLPSKNELTKLKVQTEAWDYLISPNRYTSEILKRGFRYGGEILETGYPRNDVLVRQPELITRKVQHHFGLSSEKKIVLFAPTFRDWDTNSFRKVLDDVQKMSSEIDRETVILLRLHYLLAEKISQIELPANVINASTYQDIQELYLLADVMVTDYSSAMFDFAILMRPIVLYCYDLEEYITRRGMYFNFTELAPGPVCRTIDEVLHFLNHPDEMNYFLDDLKRFSLEFSSLEDGNASAKVIERVFKKK